VPYSQRAAGRRRRDQHRLQDYCPQDLSEHVAVAFDPVAAQYIVNGDPTTPPRCAATRSARKALPGYGQTEPSSGPAGSAGAGDQRPEAVGALGGARRANHVVPVGVAAVSSPGHSRVVASAGRVRVKPIAPCTWCATRATAPAGPARAAWHGDREPASGRAARR